MKCCTKKKLTKKEAQEHLNHLHRKGNFKNGRIYPCLEHVGFWHITHTEFLEKEEREVVEVELTMKKKWEKLLPQRHEWKKEHKKKTINVQYSMFNVQYSSNDTN